MFNAFKIRKWSALILAMSITTTGFAVMTIFYGMLWGIVTYIALMLLMALVSNLLLRNPFTDMLEGKGLLVIDMNSTGVLKLFIVGVNHPYIQGNIKGQQVKDVFDRSAVYQLSEPEKSVGTSEWKDGKLVLSLTEQEYNKGKFALYHYPVLIWNSAVKSFVTKDFLAEQEKTTFAEHTVLYLNRIMEDLTSVVRDFGRYVVELTKPQGSGLMGKWWVWVLIGGAIIILVAMFGPQLLAAFKGPATAASTTISNVGGAPVVTPA